MPPEELEELEEELDEDELLELDDDDEVLLDVEPPPKLPFSAFTTAGNQEAAIFS